MTQNLSRRRFLSTAGGLAVAGPATIVEASRKPALDVIDCHTHFYDPTRPEGIPWPRKGSSLYRTVLPRHLRALTHARKVTGTVIVEASNRLEDNQWLLDIAKDDPFVLGVVGHLDPSQPGYVKNVRRFARNRLFRGIRVSEGLVTSRLKSNSLDVFKVLQDHDLELDVNGGTVTPLVVSRLAARMPGLRLLQKHIGNVAITKAPPPKDWVSNIRAAASHKNVFCKVSAMVEGASRGGGKAPTDVAFYKPYLDVVWESFGDDRVIYGSDWPVSERAASYRQQQQIVLDYVGDRGRTAVKQFFSLNSQRAYKWVERDGRIKT